MPKINKILEVYLSLDESLVGDDKIVRPSSFSTCHDGGRFCHSVVLRGDYYRYELDGDARHRQGFYPGSAAVWV